MHLKLVLCCNSAFMRASSVSHMCDAATQSLHAQRCTAAGSRRSQQAGASRVEGTAIATLAMVSRGDHPLTPILLTSLWKFAQGRRSTVLTLP